MASGSRDREKKEKIAVDSGRFLSVTTISNSFIISYFLVMAGFSVIALSSIEYSKKVTIRGYIDATTGVINIRAPSRMIVDKVKVKEGDIVQKEDFLFSLKSEQRFLTDSNYNTQKLRLLENRLNILEEERTAIIRSRKNKLNKIEEKISSEIKNIIYIKKQKDLLTGELIISSDRLDHISRLGEMDYASKREIENTKIQKIDSELSIAELSNRLEISETKLSNLRLEKEYLKKENFDVIRYKKEKNSLQQEILNLKNNQEMFLPSPVDGLVSYLNTEEGSVISSNDILARITPSPIKLEAVLFLDPGKYTSVKVGDKINIKVDSYPHEKFGSLRAKVKNVSSATFQTSVSDNKSESFGGKYKIVSTVNRNTTFGDELPLNVGMSISGEILTEKRTLFGWIFQPIVKYWNEF